jgi:hypothetical protein
VRNGGAMLERPPPADRLRRAAAPRKREADRKRRREQQRRHRARLANQARAQEARGRTLATGGSSRGASDASDAQAGFPGALAPAKIRCWLRSEPGGVVARKGGAAEEFAPPLGALRPAASPASAGPVGWPACFEQVFIVA